MHRFTKILIHVLTNLTNLISYFVTFFSWHLSQREKKRCGFDWFFPHLLKKKFQHQKPPVFIIYSQPLFECLELHPFIQNIIYIMLYFLYEFFNSFYSCVFLSSSFPHSKYIVNKCWSCPCI